MAVMDQHLETFYSADVDMNGIQSHVSLWPSARTFAGALINGLYRRTVLGLCACGSVCAGVHASLFVCVCLHSVGILIRTNRAKASREGERAITYSQCLVLLKELKKH